MTPHYKDEYHLFEIEEPDTKSYLLIRNRIPDARSIKENVFSEIVVKAKEQLNLLTQYYLKSILNVEANVIEIGRMQELPIGDLLHQDDPDKLIRVKLIRGNDNWCIIGTGESKEEFYKECKENIEEYGNEYSSEVEEYDAYFMSSHKYREISDIDADFLNCTRYDYKHNIWVKPKNT